MKIVNIFDLNMKNDISQVVAIFCFARSCSFHIFHNFIVKFQVL